MIKQSVSFPDPPDEVVRDSTLREAAVKGNALLKLGIKKQHSITHDSDVATAVADATYNFPEKDTGKEYYQLALQEISFLEAEVSDSLYTYELKQLRELISKECE